MKKIIITTFILVGLFACEDGNPIKNKEPLEVTIISQDGNPVEGATVEGGIDWDFFRVKTNASGIAALPGSARNKRAVIYKTNYLPIIVPNISPVTFTLNRTEKRIDPIGAVLGKTVRFGTNEIITLDYQGNYRVYSYNDESVAESFSQNLGDSVVAIKEIKLLNNILWFTTHESGVFAFSIQNPVSPQLINHLAIPGYLGPFALKDSIIILVDQWKPGPIRIFNYSSNGNVKEISRIENYFVRKLSIIGNYMILLGNNDTLPTIFDISNPAEPRLVYNGLEWEYQNGFFYKQLVILTPQNGYGGNNIRLDYKIVNLSNPSSPTVLNQFPADSWITGLASDNLAFGNYYYHNQTISLLSGSIWSGFHTIATVSEGAIEGITGIHPPYFIVGSKLWRLNE